MKNPTPNVVIAITAAALLFSFHSVQAQTCQEKRDACVAECKQKDPAKKEACIKKCDDAAKECANNRTTFEPQVPARGVDLKACLEGGAPCRQPVAKICKLIAGPCEDCWKTLCGGNWSFGANLPLQVKLVAATNPAKGGRMLATSSMKGKQSVLKVPAQLKLNKQEQFYFEFSSKQKPTGPVKLQVQKS